MARQHRLTDDVAIATAELQALKVALGIILDKARTGPNYGNTPLICTDSLSALQAIESDNPARPDLVKEVYNTLEALAQEEVTPTLLWVPSHCDIQGNEEADRLAKGALEMEQQDMPIRLGPKELTTKIKIGIIRDANTEWNSISNSESCELMRQAVPNPYSTKIPLDEKFIKRNRLLVNRPYFYVRRSEVCETCNVKKSPEHMLLTCPRLTIERNRLESRFRHEHVDFTLGNILNPNPPKELLGSILRFIKDLSAIEEI